MEVTCRKMTIARQKDAEFLLNFFLRNDINYLATRAIYGDRGLPALRRAWSLFRTVGQDWLWYSRLIMPNDELRTILDDFRVSIYAIRRGEHDVGILELDFREPGACELAFF